MKYCPKCNSVISESDKIQKTTVYICPNCKAAVADKELLKNPR